MHTAKRLRKAEVHIYILCNVVVTIMYLCGTLGHAWKTVPDSIQVLALALLFVAV